MTIADRDMKYKNLIDGKTSSGVWFKFDVSIEEIEELKRLSTTMIAVPYWRHGRYFVQYLGDCHWVSTTDPSRLEEILQRPLIEDLQ